MLNETNKIKIPSSKYNSIHLKEKINCAVRRIKRIVRRIQTNFATPNEPTFPRKICGKKKKFAKNTLSLLWSTTTSVLNIRRNSLFICIEIFMYLDYIIV
jgi:hypothetical protein